MLQVMNSHRKLLAWQACRELTREVYRVTSSFPPSERYGLSNQLRRAAVSAMANIAEGHGRWGPRESAHGASIALGSLAEIDALFAVSADLGYLGDADLQELESLHTSASKLTYGWHRTLRSK
jgi:four helix bundle protein